MKSITLYYFTIISFLLFSACGFSKNNKTENTVQINEVKDVSSAVIDTNTQNKLSEEKEKPVEIIDTENSEGKAFTLISATSQKWHGGIKGSGGGTNYEIILLAQLPSSKLIIDELWIDETFHSVSASCKFPKTSADGFVKGDTVYVYASIYVKDPNGPKDLNKTDVQETAQNAPPPYDYKGSGLVGYKMNGERKYSEISTFAEKPPLKYQ